MISSIDQPSLLSRPGSELPSLLFTLSKNHRILRPDSFNIELPGNLNLDIREPIFLTMKCFIDSEGRSSEVSILKFNSKERLSTVVWYDKEFEIELYDSTCQILRLAIQKQEAALRARHPVISEFNKRVTLELHKASLLQKKPQTWKERLTDGIEFFTTFLTRR